MPDDSTLVAGVADLKQLLDNKLLPEDVEDFDASDLRLLVVKGYWKERHLHRATRHALQAPPGEALKYRLIDILLKQFNPLALQPGSSTAAELAALCELFRCLAAATRETTSSRNAGFDSEPDRPSI